MRHDYNPAEDAAIRHRTVPDAILGDALGLTARAIRCRRQRLGGAVTLPPEEGVTHEERMTVLAEEIGAYRSRVAETERTLDWLRKTLAEKERAWAEWA